jgi:peptide-methionine (S)-S-oxide reductase
MTEKIIFGGGCFWCTEAVFKMIKGVQSVKPGYSGGTIPNPTYEQVCGGTTGHAEAVSVEYDPELVKFRDLLTVFFGSHDPTTKNRQGNDVGTQYRSVIFYTTNEQKIETENFIKEINSSSSEGRQIVTELEPLTTFYEAENYHHDYFEKNPGNPYCEVIINPKLDKVQKQFASLIKEIEK